jgi:hypothetical protein
MCERACQTPNAYRCCCSNLDAAANSVLRRTVASSACTRAASFCSDSTLRRSRHSSLARFLARSSSLTAREMKKTQMVVDGLGRVDMD